MTKNMIVWVKYRDFFFFLIKWSFDFIQCLEPEDLRRSWLAISGLKFNWFIIDVLNMLPFICHIGLGEKKKKIERRIAYSAIPLYLIWVYKELALGLW